jgi:hypothetical protein
MQSSIQTSCQGVLKSNPFFREHSKEKLSGFLNVSRKKKPFRAAHRLVRGRISEYGKR